MKTKSMRALAMMATLPFMQTLSAQLPTLEQPWLGCFAVADEDSYRLSIASGGQFQLLVLKKNGDPIALYPIALAFLASETLPDGSVRDLPMQLDTVESADPPTAKLKKTVLRGKLTEQATGQPTLEITIENSGDTILASARVTDNGSFDKNPLKPLIRLGFPRFYAGENAERETWDKKKVRDFDKLIGKDSVKLKHLDGKTIKLECVEKPELKPAEINAEGSSSAEVELHAYDDRKIELIAASNSSLVIGNAGANPLHHDLWFQWSADPIKDSAGKAQLAIRIK
jgi:hypothetical protein